MFCGRINQFWLRKRAFWQAVSDVLMEAGEPNSVGPEGKDYRQGGMTYWFAKALSRKGVS